MPYGSPVLRRPSVRYRKCGNKSRESSVRERKPQKISGQLAVCCLLSAENEEQNKHVESLRIACLDEGSTPSSSTGRTNNPLIFQWVIVFILKITKMCDFL